MWIAKGDLQRQEQQRSKHRTTSSFLLSLQLAQRLLSFFDVGEGELARFDQVGHNWLRAATKEGQQIVNELALSMVARDGGLEDMEVPHFLDPSHCVLPFEAIYRCLDGGVRRALALRKTLLHVANGGGSAVPEHLHDLEFKFRQLWPLHACLLWTYVFLLHQ